MADFLHEQLNLEGGDVVEVELHRQANVILLDEPNYQNYRANRNFTYYGGCAKVSPIPLKAPHSGVWHLVIDLGGTAGVLRYSARVVKG